MATQKELQAILDRHEHKELLRFVTIGSVDDGKSTLIGRLLYETGGIFKDQLEAIQTRNSNGELEINFANLTDGLQAEREQGITIDVAYRYSSTDKRKFIIADTPGHVQYTRNMATGASTASAAIILIDARHGVQAQSRRHATIADLLGISTLLVAVNKMDLVEYQEHVFSTIKREFGDFLEHLHFSEIHVTPISALKGDNIVKTSPSMPWFKGPSLLDLLQGLEIPNEHESEHFVFPVQHVLRPNLDFRGYAGTIGAGAIEVGDPVKVLPSGKRSTIKEIVTFDGNLSRAQTPLSITLTLEDEIDISRGDVLCSIKNDLHMSRHLEADLVWLHEAPLECGKNYLIKHTTNLVSAKFDQVQSRMDMESLESKPAPHLELNDVGRVQLTLTRPLVFQDYRSNRTMGAFIVIDRINNLTVGAGMIRGYAEDFQKDRNAVVEALDGNERAKRFSQKACVLWFTGRSGSGKMVVARALERRLFEAGHMPFVLDPPRVEGTAPTATGESLKNVYSQARLLSDAGLLTIVAFASPSKSDRQAARRSLPKSTEFLEVYFDAESDTCRCRLQALDRPEDEADLPYETPSEPDLVVDGDKLNVEAEVDRLVTLLASRALII